MNQHDSIATFLRKVVTNEQPDVFVQLYASLFDKVTGKNKNKSVIVSTDIDKLAAWAIKANNSTKYDLNIYYTIGAYSDVDDSEDGWAFKRTIHTVIPQNFVVLDFDYKDQISQYRNISIVGAIKQQIGEPHMVVQSGGGVHLYFKLKAPLLAVDAWNQARDIFSGQDLSLPVMDRRAGKHPHDIIRLPFTYNRKRNKKCVPIKQAKKWDAPPTLRWKGGDLFTEVQSRKPGQPTKLLIHGVPPLMPRFPQLPMEFLEADNTVSLQDYREGCAAFANFEADASRKFMRNGNLVSDREDMLTAFSIIKFAVLDKDDGNETEEDQPANRELAWEVTSNYPGAIEADHLTQYDTIVNRRGCDTWSGVYSQFCDNCPYRQVETETLSPFRSAKRVRDAHRKIESAVQAQVESLEHLPAQQRSAVLADPPSFKVDKEGVHLQSFNQGELREWTLTNKSFRFLRTGCMGIYTVVVGPDFKRKKVINLRTPSNGNIINELLNIGVTVHSAVPSKDYPKAEKALLRYVKECITNVNVVHDTTYGWSDNSTFVMPDRVVIKADDGIVYAPAVAFNSEEQYPETNVADPTEWWNATNQMLFLYPELKPQALYVLASFASPLLHFFNIGTGGAGGHVLNLFGDAGSGKTAVTKVANSVWGLRTKFSSTDAARDHTLGVNQHLPVTYDDFLRGYKARRDDADPVTKLVHEVSEGTTKDKMGAVLGVKQRARRFNLNVLTNTNTCMYTIIEQGNRETQAAEDRLTQIHVSQMKTLMYDKYGIDLVQASKHMEHICIENEAVAGAEMVSFIMQHKDKCRSWMKQISEEVSDLVTNKQHKIHFWTGIKLAVYILKSMGRLRPDFMVSAEYIAQLDGGGVFKASGERKSAHEMSEALITSRNELTWEDIRREVLWLSCEKDNNRPRTLNHIDLNDVANGPVASRMVNEGHGWRWRSKKPGANNALDEDVIRYMVPATLLQRLAFKLRRRSESLPDMQKRFKLDMCGQMVTGRNYNVPMARESFRQELESSLCFIFTPDDYEDQEPAIIGPVDDTTEE